MNSIVFLPKTNRGLALSTLMIGLSMIAGGCSGLAGVEGGFLKGETTEASLSLSSHDFGEVTAGTPESQTVALQNDGDEAIESVTISVSGPDSAHFSVSDSCGDSVAAAESCELTVTLDPAAGGDLDAEIIIDYVEDGENKQLILPVSGTGSLPPSDVSFSVSSHDFGSVDTSSTADQGVNLDNTGGSGVTEVDYSISGPDAADFSATDNCGGTTIAAGANCDITVTFDPSATGAKTATLEVTYTEDGYEYTETVDLSGTATAPTSSPQLGITPDPYDFGTITMGNVQYAAFVLDNTGDAPATSLTITSSDAGVFPVLNSNCGTSLGDGSNCSFEVYFFGSAVTSFNETISIDWAERGGDPLLTVDLSGTVNGGDDWHLTTTASGTPGAFSFFDDDYGILGSAAKGNYYRYTSDGGQTWQSGTYAGAGSYTVKGQTYSAFFGGTVDHLYASQYVNGGGHWMYESLDGGVSWSEIGTMPAAFTRGVCYGASDCVGYGFGKLVTSSDGFITNPYENQTSVYDFFRLSPGEYYFADGRVSYSDDNGASVHPVIGLNGDKLKSIDIAGSKLIAVGEQGIYRESIDGGVTWNYYPFTASTASNGHNLNDISCVSANHCIALGYGGDLYETLDGGATWTNFFDANIDSIQFEMLDSTTYLRGYYQDLEITTDSGSTWTTLYDGQGSNNNILRLETASMNEYIWSEGGYESNVVLTTDGGATLKKVVGAAPFTSLETVGTTIVFAGDEEGFLLKSTDAGLTWDTVYNFEQTAAVESIHFLDSNTGFVGVRGGSSPGIYRTNDGGLSFTLVHAAVSGSTKAYDIEFVDANNGWAVGHTMEYINPTYYNIAKTTDGGATWTQVNAGTDTLYAVDFFDANNGCAVGRQLILCTTDAGVTWTAPTTYPDDNNIVYEEVVMTSATDVWISYKASGSPNIGTPYAGTVAISTDNGDSWSVKGTFGTGSYDDVFDLAFDSNLTYAWASGHWKSFHRSVDGGNTWSDLSDFGHDYGADRYVAYNHVQVLDDTAVSDDDTVLISTTSFGEIFRSVDSGVTWNEVFAGGAKAGLGLAYDPSDSNTIWMTIGQRNQGDPPVYVMKSTDAGVSWTRSPSIGCRLGALKAFDSNNLIAVATSGGASCYETVFVSADGGASWSSVSLPTSAAGGYRYVFEVEITDSLNGDVVVAGDRGRIWTGVNFGQADVDWTLRTPDSLSSFTSIAKKGTGSGLTAVGYDGSILDSVDGLTWNTVSSGTTERLTGVRYSDQNVGFAAGFNGTLLETSDGGANWSAVDTSALPANRGWDFDVLEALSDGTAVAAGDEGGIARISAGAATDVSSVPIPDTVNEMQAMDHMTVYAVQEDEYFIRSYDGGESWEVIDVDPGNADTNAFDLNGLHFVSQAEGWVVGDWDSQIYHTNDGGDSWTLQAAPAASERYQDVMMVDSETGWAVGDNDAIAYTSDGGANWSAQSTGASTTDFEEVYALDASTAVIVGNGGAIYRTADGGANWTDVSVGGVTDDLMAVDFGDADNGVIVGQNGTILVTSNGGAGWATLGGGPSGNLYDVSMPDPNTIAIADYNNRDIVTTLDGGVTWNTYNAFETFGYVRSIFMLNSSYGWVSSGSGKIGRTWSGGVDP